MVSFNSVLAFLAASAVASTSYAAPMRALTDALNVRAEPVSEMAVGRDGLDLMEKQWLQDREVINPQITYPTADTVWTAGQTVKVTWDASVATGQFSDYKGRIVLGYEEAGKEGYNLDLEHPLAQDFKLSAGSESFALPSDLPEKNSYFVVLFGDSGNKSASFTIKAAGGDDSKHPHPHPHPEPASDAAQSEETQDLDAEQASEQ